MAMGIFDFLNKGFPEGAKVEKAKLEAAQPAQAAQPTQSGLSLKQVLDTHQDCKASLQKVLEGESNEVLDIEIVSADKHCTLGKWIYKEGKQLYGDLPEYELARKAHAEFHVYAGEALKQHQLGNQVFADVILKTKFRNTSNKNQLALNSLFGAAKFR
jgi:Chemoreceptor zinc-binding domain